MIIKTRHPGMLHADTADLAYWERNVLALRYADGWYNDDIPDQDLGYDPDGCDECADAGEPMKPRYTGWRRVLTLDGGRITFHIPDDFDVGNLPEVQLSWDGHTTEEKWRRILAARGITA